MISKSAFPNSSNFHAVMQFPSSPTRHLHKFTGRRRRQHRSLINTPCQGSQLRPDTRQGFKNGNGCQLLRGNNICGTAKMSDFTVIQQFMDVYGTSLLHCIFMSQEASQHNITPGPGGLGDGQTHRVIVPWM